MGRAGIKNLHRAGELRFDESREIAVSGELLISKFLLDLLVEPVFQLRNKSGILTTYITPLA